MFKYLLLLLALLGGLNVKAADSLRVVRCGIRLSGQEAAVPYIEPVKPMIAVSRMLQIGGSSIIALSPLMIQKTVTDGKAYYNYQAFNKCLMLGAGTALLGLLNEMVWSHSQNGRVNPLYSCEKGLKIGIQPNGIGLGFRF